jgi:hypothetical protein
MTCTLDSFAIPIEVRQTLLPDPNLSISQILRFTLPSPLKMAVTTVNIAHFVSAQLPTFTDNTEVLKSWLIPSYNVLQNIQAKAIESGARSICYPHLPASHPARRLYFPLWVLTYWREASLLCMDIIAPWSRAELWLMKEKSGTTSYRSPDKRRLCEEAQAMFLAIPWAGDVHGFTEAEPTIKLACYLSRNWLATAHGNHQLDLLRWNLTRSGVNPKSLCEIVNLSFFKKVMQIYRTRDTMPYSAAAGARHLWSIGEELAKGIRTMLVGILNVNDSHWIAVAVDATRSTIRCGDSLGGGNNEVKAAIAWWISAHIPHKFSEEDLPITHQQDSHSCLIFAINAAGHFTLPEQIPLLRAEDAAKERISMFVQVAQCDVKLVSSESSNIIKCPKSEIVCSFG